MGRSEDKYVHTYILLLAFWEVDCGQCPISIYNMYIYSYSLKYSLSQTLAQLVNNTSALIGSILVYVGLKEGLKETDSVLVEWWSDCSFSSPTH